MMRLLHIAGKTSTLLLLLSVLFSCGTPRRLSNESLADAVVSHATTHDGFVGGWLDPSDSLYYFDSVRLFPEDSLEAAVNFGKANFQKAIYKLSTGEEIILKEDVSSSR